MLPASAESVKLKGKIISWIFAFAFLRFFVKKNLDLKTVQRNGIHKIARQKTRLAIEGELIFMFLQKHRAGEVKLMDDFVQRIDDVGKLRGGKRCDVLESDFLIFSDDSPKPQGDPSFS